MVWIHIGRLDIPMPRLGLTPPKAELTVFPDVSVLIDSSSTSTEVYARYNSPTALGQYSFAQIRAQFEVDFNLGPSCWAWTRQAHDEAVILRTLQKPSTPQA